MSKRGVFRQHDETDDLDASLLLLPIMGFLPPDDKRIRATVLAIADELTEDGLVLRYKVEGTDTGFEGKEGTFTICSFWLVSTLAMIGETERARALCQKLLSFAGPLQLYAEEIDTSTGEHMGNFPQAFTHLALIEAVSLLIESEQKAKPRGLLRVRANPGGHGVGVTWRGRPAGRGGPPGERRSRRGALGRPVGRIASGEGTAGGALSARRGVPSRHHHREEPPKASPISLTVSCILPQGNLGAR